MNDAGHRTSRVAEFARELRWDDISTDVQGRAIRRVLDLCAAVRDLGVGVSDVARARRVHTFEAATRLRSAAPCSTEETQFSLQWPVACVLNDGEAGPGQVLGHACDDPDRGMLAARIELFQDLKLEEAFPAKALAWVETEASDGRGARSEILAARGDTEARLSEEEFTHKFESLVEPLLDPGRIEELARAIHALPWAKNPTRSQSCFAPASRRDKTQPCG
ncbi:MAG: hypothetical protein ACR2N0_06490 [Rubrobacteraceae bacterium]